MKQNNNIIVTNLDKNREEQNIKMNANDKATINEKERKKILSPLLHDWKVPKKWAKIKEEYKSYNTTFGHVNYYDPFHLYISEVDKEDKNDEDLIKILKEIKRREDATVLVKEVRKKTKIINSEKQ